MEGRDGGKSHLEGMPLFSQPKASSWPNSKEKPSKIDLQEAVNGKLMFCPREEQLGLLHRILQPSNIDIDLMFRAITWDLMIVLNKLRFYYKIHQYGSTITGLAFRGRCFNLSITVKFAKSPFK